MAHKKESSSGSSQPPLSLMGSIPSEGSQADDRHDHEQHHAPYTTTEAALRAEIADLKALLRLALENNAATIALAKLALEKVGDKN